MSAKSSALREQVGRYAALTRSRTPDDPVLLDTRQRLNAERIAAYVERVLAGSALTAAQAERIGALLIGGESR